METGAFCTPRHERVHGVGDISLRDPSSHKQLSFALSPVSV